MPIYGYCRVSTKKQEKDGNGLAAQEKAVKDAGATIIYMDAFTGTKTDRPEFQKLLSEIKSGDTIVVTKLDRVARNAAEGNKLVDHLMEKGVKIHILNMGLLDQTPTGKLIRNILLAFAEFERDLIVERTQEGKNIARQRPDFREGRPRKFKSAQRAHIRDLLEQGHTVSEVCRLLEVSRATVYRIKKEQKALCDFNSVKLKENVQMDNLIIPNKKGVVCHE